MEALLHYCWKHKILPLGDLLTTDGRMVEVIDVGFHNQDAGPDFFNAKIKIDGTLWCGNIEIHNKSMDWYAHHHDKDNAYDNVILHVVGTTNGVVTSNRGNILPEIVINIPERIRRNHQQLLSNDKYPPCYKIIPELSSLKIHGWMAALQTERLQQKTESIIETLKMLDYDWERTYFVTLARSYGFGTNSDALEFWARTLPFKAIAHHRDDIMQIEAFFFGHAGLLNPAAASERTRLEVAADAYRQRLEQEYTYLRNKFSTSPIDARCWKFMRMRPQNFPTIRIAQLARLYHESRTMLSHILTCDNTDSLRKLLSCGVSDYWETHYTFGHESTRNTKMLSSSSINILMINAVIPIFFAYGRETGKESLCEKAFDLLEELSAENNNITRMWQEVGLCVKNAGDSQALIQLKKQYCDRKDCLRCRIGYEYLRK